MREFSSGSISLSCDVGMMAVEVMFQFLAVVRKLEKLRDVKQKLLYCWRGKEKQLNQWSDWLGIRLTWDNWWRLLGGINAKLNHLGHWITDEPLVYSILKQNQPPVVDLSAESSNGKGEWNKNEIQFIKHRKNRMFGKSWINWEKGHEWSRPCGIYGKRWNLVWSISSFGFFEGGKQFLFLKKVGGVCRVVYA